MNIFGRSPSSAPFSSSSSSSSYIILSRKRTTSSTSRSERVGQVAFQRTDGLWADSGMARNQKSEPNSWSSMTVLYGLLLLYAICEGDVREKTATAVALLGVQARGDISIAGGVEIFKTRERDLYWVWMRSCCLRCACDTNRTLATSSTIDTIPEFNGNQPPGGFVGESFQHDDKHCIATC